MDEYEMTAAEYEAALEAEAQAEFEAGYGAEQDQHQEFMNDAW